MVDKYGNICYYKDNKTRDKKTEVQKRIRRILKQEIPIVKGISKNLRKGGTDRRNSR